MRRLMAPRSTEASETLEALQAEVTSPFETRFVATAWESEPLSQTQYFSLFPGRFAELHPRTTAVPEFILFWNDSRTGAVSGKTYRNAYGRLILSAIPLPDGSAQVEIYPVIEYGEKREHIWASNGAFHRGMVRPRKVFGDCRVSQPLMQGQMLVIGPSSEQATGYGRAYFTREQGGVEQKIMVIRLVRTPPVLRREP